MRNTTVTAACRWLLLTQVALTVLAAALAGVAVGSAAGVMVSSPLLLFCVVLLAGGGLGIVAVGRGSRDWSRRAGLVLLVPAVLAIGSILTPAPEAEAIPHGLVPEDVMRSWYRTLALLTWAHRLAFVAVVLAAVAGVLILLHGNGRAGQSERT